MCVLVLLAVTGLTFFLADLVPAFAQSKKIERTSVFVESADLCPIGIAKDVGIYKFDVDIDDSSAAIVTSQRHRSGNRIHRKCWEDKVASTWRQNAKLKGFVGPESLGIFLRYFIGGSRPSFID